MIPAETIRKYGNSRCPVILPGSGESKKAIIGIIGDPRYRFLAGSQAERID
jgi:hypothetical protein